MSERLSIELQASDRARNRYRRWHLAAGQDLFGRWHARVTFGCIGCEGRTIRHEFVNKDDAAAFIRACLRRRATVEKRLAMCPRPRLNGMRVVAPDSAPSSRRCRWLRLPLAPMPPPSPAPPPGRDPPKSESMRIPGVGR